MFFDKLNKDYQIKMEQTFGITKKKETKTHYERMQDSYKEQEAENIEFAKLAY